ncbi:MAG: ribonuclease P protein component [Mariprofundaceae bacterium]|nr:ribonuclease P protein component [Mariprofundaceae bacterium]
MPENRFPAGFRLRTRRDFASLRKGKRFSYRGLRFVYQPTGRGHARLGLAVSARYGTAVQRNRLKRKIREAFRTSCLRNMGVDLLVIPLACASEMGDVSGIMHVALEKIVRSLEG